MAFRKAKPRKKVCYFKKNGIKTIDYKDVELLKKFITPNGKITPRRVTGHIQLVTNVYLQQQLKTRV